MTPAHIPIHIPKSACPHCGYEMEMCTGIDPHACPKEGDISICFNCGEVLTWDVNLAMVSPSEEQLKEFLTDPTVKQDVRQIRQRGRFL